MKKIAVVVLLLILAAIIAGGVWWWTHRSVPAATVPLAALPGPAIEYYTCSMHPFLREPEPGLCPICNMRLDPVYARDAATDTSVPAIAVSAAEEQRLGMRLAAVRQQAVTKVISAYARIETNEEKLTHIHTRYEGYVDKLFVSAVGQSVRRGDPLFTIYAPEVVAAQEEYLIALLAQGKLGTDAHPLAVAHAASLAQASHTRLELLEVPADVIRRIETERHIARTITHYAGVNGIVAQRNVTAGERITPDTDLFLIADLSAVWVIADIFEQDMPDLRVGLPVTVTFAGLPGREFRGRVSYIYPFLDEATRTARARLELDNRAGQLRPGMFGDVLINTGMSRRALVVPLDAVLRGGGQDIVFKQVAPGNYVPAVVTLGGQFGDMYAVSSGLSDGDTIVARANFYLDAEARLRFGDAAATGHAGHASPAAPSPAVSAPAAVPPAMPAAAAADPHAGHGR